MKAWANSSSIADEDRIVFLKIAIDALTGTDKTDGAKNELISWFTALEPTSTRGLLWAPDQPAFERTSRSGKTIPETAFGHWLHAFADQRNHIVHHGHSTSLTYEVADSPYNGHYVDVADRVVCEALLVGLHRCGTEYLWRTSRYRQLYAWVTEGSTNPRS